MSTITPAKRERLTVLSKNYMVRKVLGDHEHPPNPEPLEDQLSEEDIDNYEKKIEKDFDDELEAEQKATTGSLLKSRKFLIIYMMSISELIYPLYFNAIFKELG